jgi:hypothetical protein
MSYNLALRSVSCLVSMVISFLLGLGKSPLFSTPTLIFYLGSFFMVCFFFNLYSRRLRARFGKWFFLFGYFSICIFGFLLISCVRLYFRQLDSLLGMGVFLIFVFGPGEMVGTRMMPAGSDSANSGNWRDYLNLSPEEDSVGGGSNEPAAENPPAAAPHPRHEEAQNEAPPLAQEALPQNAPSVLELRHQLDHFTSSYNRISMRSDFLLGLYEKLGVFGSSPERRNKILEGMRIISALQGQERPSSGKKAGDALVDFMREWDQQQG